MSGTLAGWPLVALTTVASEADAERIARSLVDKGLAACVNVVPGVVSFYRWKDGIERDQEWLLVIKTRGERFEELKTALVAEHPYELPELIAMLVVGGHEAYLDWLDCAVNHSE
jgi:periplasmic divalent cation tolerance protein